MTLGPYSFKSCRSTSPGLVALSSSAASFAKAFLPPSCHASSPHNVFTTVPSGFVTGNIAADLQTQLAALLTYNQGWSQFIPALNAATSATQAADIYMNDFERPGFPAAANREAAAQAVAAACGI